VEIPSDAHVCWRAPKAAISGFLVAQAEARTGTAERAGAAHALREYLHGNTLMLYIAMGADATVYLLSIRHHRQLSFDFARLWPGA